MGKLKSLNLSSFISILKCCLLGIVATLVGTVLFAVVLKFVDLSSVVISYVNNVLKAIGIFFTMICVKKSNDGKLILKAVLAGVLYAILSFVIFSLLNGKFVFNLSFLYDLLFAVVVACIVSVIVNLTFRKKV